MPTVKEVLEVLNKCDSDYPVVLKEAGNTNPHEHFDINVNIGTGEVAFILK